MKTLLDLKALIPTIIAELEAQEKKIGDYQEREYESNSFTFEEDGWYIEIEYSCTGYWCCEPQTWDDPGCCEVRGWGEIDDIRVSHYDEETDEESEFSEEDLTDLYTAVKEVLKYIE